MSSRHNFLDADNSIMERNLRFVTNDLEDNLNQYFGGSGSRGHNPAISAPPRDYKVVQPKPESYIVKTENDDDFLQTRHFLDQRRKFLIQIGVSRNIAHGLGKNTRFDVTYYRELRNELLKEGLGQAEIDPYIYSIIENGDYKRDNNNDRQDKKNKRAAEREMANLKIEQNCPDFKVDFKTEDNEAPAPPTKIEWNTESQIHKQQDSHGHRTRSRSPFNNDRKEEHHFKDNQFYRTNSPPKQSRRNVINSPFKYLNYMDDREIRNYSRRSRSPLRKERYNRASSPRKCERNIKNFRSLSPPSPSRYFSRDGQRGGAIFETLDPGKCSPSPPRNIRSYQSRSKSPPRGGFMLLDREFRRNVDNSPSRYLNYEDERQVHDQHISHSPFRNDTEYLNFRSLTPRDSYSMQDDREFGRNVNTSPSANENYRYDRRSRSPLENEHSSQIHNSIEYKREFERNINTSPSVNENYRYDRRSRSPLGNEHYFHIQNAIQDNREFERNINTSPSVNENYRYDRRSRSPLGNEHTSQIQNSMQDYGEFGRNVNTSPSVNKNYNYERRSRSPLGNVLRVEISRSRSPPRDLNLSQDERRFERNVNSPSRYLNYNDRGDHDQNIISQSLLRNRHGKELTFGSFELSRSRSPPMQCEKRFERNVNNSLSRGFDYETMNECEYYNQRMLSRSPLSNEQREESNFQLFRSRSPIQGEREFGRNVNNSPRFFSLENGERKMPNFETLQSSGLRSPPNCMNGIGDYDQHGLSRSPPETIFGSFKPSNSPCVLETKDFKSFELASSIFTSRNLSSLKEIEDTKNAKQLVKPYFYKAGLEPSFKPSLETKVFKSFEFASSSLPSRNLSSSKEIEGNLKNSQMSSNINNGFGKENSSPEESKLSSSSTLAAKSAAFDPKKSKETVKDIRNTNIIQNNNKSAIFVREWPTKTSFSSSSKVSSDNTVVSQLLSISSTQGPNISLSKNQTPSFSKLQNSNKIQTITSKTVTSIMEDNTSSSSRAKSKYIWINKNLSSVNTPSSTTTQYTWRNTTPSSTNINNTQNKINPQPQFLESLKIPISKDSQCLLKSNTVPKNKTSCQEPKKFKDSYSLQDSPKTTEITKNENKKQSIKRIDVYKRRQANFTYIKSGLKKPSAGHLKAKPKEYWTRWWSIHKYIEYSVMKVDPEDVYQDLHMTLEPHHPEFQAYKTKLLKTGLKKINRNLFLNECKYPYADSYRLFKFKKHIEDPKFHKELSFYELKRVQTALRRLEDKPKIAFLHQALICRWHSSVDILKRASNGEMIKFRYARFLLRNKTFNYLVLESIQILKKLCQEDWPGFEEFYNNLKVEKFDSSDIALLHEFGPKADSLDDEDDEDEEDNDVGEEDDVIILD